MRYVHESCSSPDARRAESAPSAASIAASISAMRNGWPLTLVSDLRVDQELVAQHGLELAHVHFGHEDMFEALQ